MNGPDSLEARMAAAEARVRQHPGEREAVLSLALFKTHARRFAEAVALVKPLAEADPKDRRALELYAGALFGGARYREAAVPLTRLVAVDPGNFEYRKLLTQALCAIGYAERAIDVYRPVFDAEAEGFDKYFHYGSVHFLAGRPAEGERLLNRALAFSPGSADTRAAIAQCKIHLGEIEAAATLCWEILATAPAHGVALSLLAELDPAGFPDSALKAVRTKAEAADTPTGLAITLRFAAGKVELEQGEPEAAFRHFSSANALAKKVLEGNGLAYDHARELEKFAAIKGLFTREVTGAPASGGGRVPIFIFGLPRSGTTLIEQILSAHPRVHGAGEAKALGEIFLEMEAIARAEPATPPVDILRGGREAWARAYFERLGPIPATATHTTDKMPLNFPYVGLARFLFPNARFICIRRNPRDACVSMFCQPLNDSYPAAVDLEWLGQFHTLFESYMTWWDEQEPGGMLSVRYEDAISDQEAATRKMLEFVGLPWDPACLAFSANPRVVTTLSNVQVRRPLSAESIGRWKAFEPYLAPLIRSLGVSARAAPRKEG
jgi:tetratricopeptide (TPR) repeat protein